MTGMTFQRYEKKYMLSRAQYTALWPLLQGRLQSDEYGSYTISNLYYDTDQFDLIRMSIEKPVYKEKLRLRCYGAPDDESPVFLELKKKYEGIVYKRRAKLPYAQAEQFVCTGGNGMQDSQILKEIAYFLGVYDVKPKVFLCYDRVALTGVEDKGLRVTFDTNIRFRETALGLTEGTWGRDLLGPNQVLMEIKVPGAFPLWMSRLLSELMIFPTSFSKYKSCYAALLADGRTRGEVERSA